MVSEPSEVRAGRRRVAYSQGGRVGRHGRRRRVYVCETLVRAWRVLCM